MLSKNLLIETGNILSLNELKKIAGLNTRDELIETLKIILKDTKPTEISSTAINGKTDVETENVDRKELKITVKVFISTAKAEVLKQALDEVLKVLHTDAVESLVVAYKKAEGGDDILNSLQSLWSVIEEYKEAGKILSVGLSDVDTEVFIQFFKSANIKPNIIQINLATCCVVPPVLQEFTKENDIQLLTHSDPCQILPKESVTDIFGADTNLHWVARYQIHLRCRGVLSSKGYLVYIEKPTSTPS
ncbi:glutamate--cysteine ligase regulatory subunit isoform X2 [Belonocnema kinseyi]|uniref:glutamate--cysteine ligase regulatory subunit isoform X2 n=1 Tax=Belonocnema kinseyi TaxID=2817044 RepID=UPI00143D6454|nr:glutamate--cysteine ligase regulatory subunit isoform X2 [Belonocnema kinseyi]